MCVFVSEWDPIVNKLCPGLSFCPQHTSFLACWIYFCYFKDEVWYNRKCSNLPKFPENCNSSLLPAFFFCQVSLSQEGWENMILGSKQNDTKLLWSSLNERPYCVNVHCRIKLNQSVHVDCISVAMNNILWMKHSRICVTQRVVSSSKFSLYSMKRWKKNDCLLARKVGSIKKKAWNTENDITSLTNVKLN